MLNAGLLAVAVVDDWKAKIWAQILPKIKVRGDVVLRDDGQTGWAIRKDSPKLPAELMDFYTTWPKKQGLIVNAPGASRSASSGSRTTPRDAE